MALLPVADALSRLLSGLDAPMSESVELHGSAGRYLSKPLRALRTQPPFDCSAMDGYAVRAEDIATIPAKLRIIGQAPAGRPFNGMVGKGEAVRIFTGAPMPDGTDTVLIQENARPIADDLIEARDATHAGRHVRRRGLDFAEGDVLLEAGRRMDAAAVSLAAAANHLRIDVAARPRVAIIATGDELLAPGSEPGPGQIIASNAYGVAAVARSVGAVAIDLGIVADRRDAIAERIETAIAGADIVVTLGGASVGDHDLVREVLLANGVELDFWKIAMRPGKPLMFGRRGSTRILGLPGNPVASLVCAHVFLKPLIVSMAGGTPCEGLRAGRLGAAIGANDERQDYVRAAVTFEDGVAVARPFQVQDSSMLRTLADARGLVVRPPHAPPASAGDPCMILMLG